MALGHIGKQPLVLDLAPEAACPLMGLQALVRTNVGAFYHEKRDMRLPLGIYNASLSRLLPRIQSFCSSLEALFAEKTIPAPEGDRATRKIVVDNLESMLYAAAEHVDDLLNIASGFFKTPKLATMDSRYRKLSNSIDRAKKLTTTATNKIKHHQARVRLLSLEIEHGGQQATLHGFYIEAIVDGVLAPHPALHKEFPVRSLSAIAWEVIDFVLEGSNALAIFLEHFPKTKEELQLQPCVGLRSAVVAAARLPTFTFGEPHTFSHRPIRLVHDDSEFTELDSGLYGSIARPWKNSRNIKYGQISQSSEGDGSSRSFKLVSPKSVSLVEWGTPL